MLAVRGGVFSRSSALHLFPILFFPSPSPCHTQSSWHFWAPAEEEGLSPSPSQLFLPVCCFWVGCGAGSGGPKRWGFPLSLSAALPNPTLLLLPSGRFERGGTPNCQIKCADLCAPPQNDLDGARPGTLNNSISPFPIRRRRGNK